MSIRQIKLGDSARVEAKKSHPKVACKVPPRGNVVGNLAKLKTPNDLSRSFASRL